MSEASSGGRRIQRVPFGAFREVGRQRAANSSIVTNRYQNVPTRAGVRLERVGGR